MDVGLMDVAPEDAVPEDAAKYTTYVVDMSESPDVQVNLRLLYATATFAAIGNRIIAGSK
jgi:hypothetical protein